MRGRLLALTAGAVSALTLLAVPIGSATASSGAPAYYSDRWLASHHTQFDTTLTAAYEAKILYNGPAAAAGALGALLTNVQMSSGTLVNNQNEFQIAINPNDNHFAVGADNDGKTSGTGYFRTSDGGQTWFSADLPLGTSSCCDPGVTYGRDGTVYFENLDTSPAVIHVMKSTDNGVTWQKMTDVPSCDRSNITVDNGADSPHQGRVYVTWSQLCSSTNEIMLNYSDDGGVTWSAPVNVSHTGATGGNYPQSSDPTVARDGTVYVGFQYYPTGTNDSAQDMIAVSHDGGATFGTAATISAGPNVQGGLDLSGDARGYFAVNSSCTTFRHRSFPIIKTSPSDPNQVYAVWAGGNLESAYTCGSLHGVHSDILFSRSTDGGATWSAPLKVNDDPPGKDQYYPWMDVWNRGTIWIGWHDRRDDPNNFKHNYYLDRSTDGGLTFGVDHKISTAQSLPSSFIGDYAGLAATQGLVLPMWWDSRVSSNGDPFTQPLHT